MNQEVYGFLGDGHSADGGFGFGSGEGQFAAWVADILFADEDRAVLYVQDRYQLMIETYTIPRIGKIKLTKLTSRDLQKLYKDLMENGRIHVGKNQSSGLSSTTVRGVHLMLHCAFERAVKERLISRNPTDDCIAPKVQKFERKTLRPEDMKSYLAAANSSRLASLRIFSCSLATESGWYISPVAGDGNMYWL